MEKKSLVWLAIFLLISIASGYSYTNTGFKATWFATDDGSFNTSVNTYPTNATVNPQSMNASNLTSGTVMRPLNLSFYDVRAFGAAGNNTVDEHDAIQAAADFVSAAGTARCMYFSPGTYNISKQINFSNNICIQGSTGASIITANNITAFYINTTNQIYYPVIAGDGLQFSFLRSDADGRTGTKAIVIEGSNYFTRGSIKDITIRGAYYGLFINQTPSSGAEILFDHNLISNIKTDNYGSSSTNYSIYFASGSGTGNKIVSSSLIFEDGGIYYAGKNISHNIGDIIIVGNSFYGSVGAFSIYMNGNATYLANNIIAANYYEANQNVFLENQSNLQYILNSPTELNLNVSRSGTDYVSLQKGIHRFRPAADQNLAILPAVSKPGAVVLSAGNDADSVNVPLEIRAANITITAGVTLGGNRFVCINGTGELYSSTTACA